MHGIDSFLLGFHGTKGPGTPTDDATGYMAAYDTADLVWDVAYGYNFSLVYGSVEDVRKEAVRQHNEAESVHGPVPGVSVPDVFEAMMPPAPAAPDARRTIAHPSLWKPAVAGTGGAFGEAGSGAAMFVEWGRANASAGGGGGGSAGAGALVSPAFHAPSRFLRAAMSEQDVPVPQLKLSFRTCASGTGTEESRRSRIRAVAIPASDAALALPAEDGDSASLSRAALNPWAGARADLAGALRAAHRRLAGTGGFGGAVSEVRNACPGIGWQDAVVDVEGLPGIPADSMVRVVLTVGWEAEFEGSPSDAGQLHISRIRALW